MTWLFEFFEAFIEQLGKLKDLLQNSLYEQIMNQYIGKPEWLVIRNLLKPVEGLLQFSILDLLVGSLVSIIIFIIVMKLINLINPIN